MGSPTAGRTRHVLVALCVAASGLLTFASFGGPAAAQDAAVTPAAAPVTPVQTVTTVFQPVPGGFVPIAPRRVVDTRTAAKLQAWQRDGRTNVQILDPADLTIPIGQVGAVALNVTIVDPDTSGAMAIWQDGTPWSGVWNVNFEAKDVRASALTVGMASTGKVSIWSLANTHVIIDITGYYTKQTTKVVEGVTVSAPSPGGGLVPHPPVPLIESRWGTSMIPAGSTIGLSWKLPYISVPSTGFTAVTALLTIVNPQTDGWATLMPTGEATPSTSVVNFKAGVNTSNQATVRVGLNSDITLYTSATAHIRVDVVGFYTAGAVGPGGFNAVGPTRVMDTRVPLGNYGYNVATNSLQLIVSGNASIPRTAHAVAANITSVGGWQPGFITVWPDGMAQPGTSTLNHRAGQVVANGAVIGLGSLKGLNLFATSNPNLIVDIAGWFSSPWVTVVQTTP